VLRKGEEENTRGRQVRFLTVWFRLLPQGESFGVASVGQKGTTSGNIGCEKRHTRHRLLAMIEAQSLAVFFCRFPHYFALNFSPIGMIFPLDKREKQPIMWTKVGQSGQ